jgi:hypothetical protein
MKTLILSLVLICAVGIARAQLTPDEQTFAKGLDPAAQTKYTATREYFHRAAAIINKTAEPTTLGRKPQAATITKARDLSNIELMKGISIAAPASSGLPAAQGVLTSDEENYAKGLNAVDRERYQATREYVHKAVAIVNKTADPASFGLRPKTYDTKYLKSDEAKIVRQAREMSNTALLKGIKIK